MYLYLEKMDSYSDGVTMTAMVFDTKEQAKAVALDTIQTKLKDLEEYDCKQFTDFDTYSGDDVWTIEAHDNYNLGIQIAEFTPGKPTLDNKALVYLMDSNGC